MAWPHLGFGPIQFAIIGMAAIVGGGTGAAMTAILMIFEMTGDYTTIVPVILAVAAAVGTRRVIMEDNIYTMKLTRRGQYIPKERHSHMFTIRKAGDVMAPIAGRLRLADLPAVAPGSPRLLSEHYAVVEDAQGRFQGVIAADGSGAPLPGASVERSFTVIREGDFLQALLTRMARRDARMAVVLRERGPLRAHRVAGVVPREGLADAILADYRD
jgi:CIC family chloride channel protein